MKKALFAAIAGVMMVSGTATAGMMDAKAVVGLSGVGGPAFGRFYKEIMKGTDFIWGWTAGVPGETTSEVSFTGNFGLGLDVPVLGRWNFITNVTKASTVGSAWMIGSVVNIEKDFLFNLTDQVKVGFTWVAASITTTSGSRAIALSPNIYPVLSAQISMM